jgi:hypothetical protein
METVTNLANAASKAIWGQQPSTTQGNETAGEEPVSGVQGKGDLNEPFDKGNESKCDPHPTPHILHSAINRRHSNSTAIKFHSNQASLFDVIN